MNASMIPGIELYPDLLARARYDIKAARARASCSGCDNELQGIIRKYTRLVTEQEAEKKFRRSPQ